MKETVAALGIATDGDADRLALDADELSSAEYFIALLFDYMVETRAANGRGQERGGRPIYHALADLSQGAALRTGGLQVHWRTDNGDKIRHRRRGVRRG